MTPVDATGRHGSVLLLGARSGIGRAIVERLVSEGTGKVLLAGREPLETLDPGYDADVETLEFDAGDVPSHEKLFDEVFTRHRSIDVVVIAFGALNDQAEVDADPSLGVEMATVNYLGAASALLHCARWMREQGSGRIIVLSSVAGLVPRRSNHVYGSTKAGIDFLARGIADALAEEGVEVMIVRPGFVRTAMTAGRKPAPFAVSPGQVAAAVSEAMTRHRRVVWVPGILRWVMTVIRMLPPRLVRRLET